jgi:hypothetical protein
MVILDEGKNMAYGNMMEYHYLENACGDRIPVGITQEIDGSVNFMIDDLCNWSLIKRQGQKGMFE